MFLKKLSRLGIFFVLISIWTSVYIIVTEKDSFMGGMTAMATLIISPFAIIFSYFLGIVLKKIFQKINFTKPAIDKIENTDFSIFKIFILIISTYVVMRILRFLIVFIAFFTYNQCDNDSCTNIPYDVYRELDTNFSANLINIFLLFIVPLILVVISYYLIIKKESLQNKIISFVLNIISLAMILQYLFIVLSPPFIMPLRGYDFLKFDMNKDLDTVWMLGKIEKNIYTYYENKSKIPNNINVVKNHISSSVDSDIIKDLDKRGISYEKINDTKYNLCANFKISDLDVDEALDMYHLVDCQYYKWKHDKGFYCYSFDVKDYSWRCNIVNK